MPHVGIIKASKVYIVRSQTTTRKMEAPFLPSNVRERKIEAGLGGAFGQAEHRFSLHNVALGAGEEMYMYNYASLIKGSLLFVKYPDYVCNTFC